MNLAWLPFAYIDSQKSVFSHTLSGTDQHIWCYPHWAGNIKKKKKKKSLSSNHFFTRRLGFGLMLILFNGEKEQNPVSLVRSYRWAAEERLKTSAGCLFEAQRSHRAAHEQPCNHLLMNAGGFQWTISATCLSNKTATLLGYSVVSSKIETEGLINAFNRQLHRIFI